MDTQTTKQKELDTLHALYQNQPDALIQFQGNKSLVFGEGNPNAKLLFIGEAPGRHEDEQGRPFVGRSGALLNKALEIAGIKRPEVFITNIVKSRPPNNRKPTAQEIQFSLPLLLRQINIIQPKLICTLGSSSLQGLLGRSVQITKERGIIINHNNLAIMPIYHPAYILRNRSELKTFAQDIINAARHTSGK